MRISFEPMVVALHDRVHGAAELRPSPLLSPPYDDAAAGAALAAVSGLGEVRGGVFEAQPPPRHHLCGTF
jgi:hypothetical protein